MDEALLIGGILLFVLLGPWVLLVAQSIHEVQAESDLRKQKARVAPNR